MAFFIGVVHRKQILAARAAGIVAFSHGRESAVRNIAAGDRVIYYAPRTDLDGDPVQAFVAHATVKGKAPYQKDWGTGFTGWARDADFDSVTETPIRPMLETLDFIPNPKNWGMAMRNGKFEIGADDYARIAGAMLGDAT